MKPTLIPIPVEGNPLPLRVDETLFRDYELAADDFLHIQVEQLGVDASLRLLAPEGDVLCTIDSPTGTSGSEEIVWISERSGTFRVEVSSATTRAEGTVLYKTLAQRAATEVDRDFVAAEMALYEGSKLVLKRQWHDAQTLLNESLNTWIEQGRPRREANTLYRLGQAYQGKSENELATAYLQRALKRYRDLPDDLLAGVTAGQLGSLHQEEGRLELALVDFEDAQNHFRRHEYGRGIGLMASRLGTTQYLLGNLRQSLEHFEEAITYLEKDHGSEHRLATVLFHYGGVFMALNRPQEAARQFERAERLYSNMGNLRGRGRALVRLANVAFRLHETERASQLAEEAIRLLSDSVEEEDGTTIIKKPIGTADFETQHDLAAALLLLGRKWKRLQNLPEATASFSEALDIARQIEGRQLEGALLLELGHVRLLSGDASAALQQFDQSQQLLTVVGDHTGEAMTRVRAAQALGTLGRLHEALRRLAPALTTAENLRTASDRLDIRIDYFAFRQEFFDVAVALEMQLHALEPEGGHQKRALETHERRRAQVSLDTLAERPFRRQAVRRELLDLEEALEEKIRRWTQSGSQGNDETLATLLGELQEVRGEIRRENRQAAPLPERAPFQLETLQNEILDPHSLVLVYALGTNRSFLWAISQTEIEVFELPKRQAIESLANNFADLLPRVGQSSSIRRQRTGHQLSDWLLGPVANRLDDQRLILVPMGTLQLISFAALPFPGTDDPKDYLVKHHAVVTVPSLNTLVHQRRRASQGDIASHSIAIFGDPVFTLDDERIPAPEAPASPLAHKDLSQKAKVAESVAREERFIQRLSDVFDFDLGRLQYSGLEVESLADIAKSDGLMATGFRANRDTFFEHANNRHRILHFATHAFQNPSHPELSSLVLSLIDENGQSREGLLSVFEIAKLDLSAEMVVLSACRTGGGRRARGEGILGLTRAFFDAGARRVVSSLWPVDDRSTAKLMIHFYDFHLRQGLEPALALQQAQQAMLEDPETTLPYHWASFVVQGD